MTTFPLRPFGELVDINPKTKLLNDVEYPFVAMEDVTPGRRYVHSSKKRKPTGGARFEPADTLLARITPCLENGKIAQYDLAGKPGFGSTEFIVLRAKPGIADPGFIHCLAVSKEIREPAILSMAGASGRQRADAKVVAETLVPAPSLETQRRIAGILTAYDDLIEVNRRRVALLEDMARGLFHCLVTAPLGTLPQAAGDNGRIVVPAGWQIVSLGNVADLLMGQSPPSELLNKDGVGLPFHQGVTDFGVLFPGNRVFCTPQNRKKVAIAGDILFSVRAPVGRINVATEEVVLGRGVCSIRSKIGTPSFLLAHLRATFHSTDLIGNGAIYKAVGREDIERVGIALPPLAIRDQVEKQLSPLFALLWDIEQSNRNLTAARDLLLPRLISGQLSVPQAERELEAA